MHKCHPISDQNGQNLRPISDQKGPKTIPFCATHTYISYIREYHPPGFSSKHGQVTKKRDIIQNQTSFLTASALPRRQTFTPVEVLLHKTTFPKTCLAKNKCVKICRKSVLVFYFSQRCEIRCSLFSTCFTILLHDKLQEKLPHVSAPQFSTRNEFV